MNWKRVNIEEELKKSSIVPNTDELIFELEKIWDNSHKQDLSLIERLKQKPSKTTPNNHFRIDFLKKDNIYHENDIKKICIDYRLRFLSSHYFKGEIPYEAISKIKELERKHETAFYNFKIIAPSKLFKLENADDPLLFIPIGNGYHYLIHKWGNDLHLLRKTWAWFFKSFENLLVLCFLVSLLCTALIPRGLFSHQPNSIHIYFFEFLFMFKSVVAVVLFYGFSKGKNFNTVIWNSKYFN